MGVPVPLRVGDALPVFSLTSAVSGLTVDNRWLAGRKAVLVVHGSKSSDAAKNVSKALRQREPDASKVAYVSVVDLRPFSGLWKKVAEAQIKASFTKLAAKATEAGLDPKEHVVICPDWDGTVSAILGVPEPDKEPAAVVVAADGKVVAIASGDEIVATAMAAI